MPQPEGTEEPWTALRVRGPDGKGRQGRLGR